MMFDYEDRDIHFFHVRDEKIDPAQFKMHTHDVCEVYFFHSGKAVFHVEGTEYPLKSGDILIMRPAESHYIRLEDTSQPYERSVLHFPPRLLDGIDPNGLLLKPFYDRQAGHLNRFRDSDFDDPDHLVYLRNLSKKTEFQRLQIMTSMFPLLNELYHASLHRKQDHTAENDTVVSRIIRYINRHLHEPVDLDSICEEFFISRSQLCRIFKQATGSTVRDYIAVKRLIEVRDYLREGMPAQKAAAACGFSDYSAFYRAYRKRFGVSPRREKSREPLDEGKN